VKTVLITIPNTVLSYGFLHTSFLDHLLRGDVKVVLAVADYRADYHRKQFAGRDDVEVVSVPSRHTKNDKLIERFFRQSIPSHTVALRQRRSYYRLTGPTPLRIARLVSVRIIWLLGHIRVWRMFLRFLFGFIPPKKEYLALMDTHHPDLVFSTALFDPIDLNVLRAARARKVRTIGMVKQWDNLSSKCFMQIHPHRLLVQNDHVKSDAIKFSDYPSKEIIVCGVPQFDFHADPSMIILREKFLEQLGLSPSARYVLFAGSGPETAPEECDALKETAEALRANPDTRHFAVVYRPHPNYSQCSTDDLGIVVHASHKRIKQGPAGWEFELDDIRQLISVLYHSDTVINIGSTVSIEAAIFDRPVICVAFGGATEPYWNTPLSYYDNNHYVPIVKTGGVRVVKSAEALARTVAEFRKNPSLDREHRARLVHEYVVSADGRAAERAARAVRDFLFQSKDA
jgi:glycosyltransferase involved in cell wall biosynthesis